MGDSDKDRFLHTCHDVGYFWKFRCHSHHRSEPQDEDDNEHAYSEFGIQRPNGGLLLYVGARWKPSYAKLAIWKLLLQGQYVLPRSVGLT